MFGLATSRYVIPMTINHLGELSERLEAQSPVFCALVKCDDTGLEP